MSRQHSAPPPGRSLPCTACSSPGSSQREETPPVRVSRPTDCWASLPEGHHQNRRNFSRWGTSHGSETPDTFQNYTVFRTSTTTATEQRQDTTGHTQIHFCRRRWFLAHTHTKNLQNNIAFHEIWNIHRQSEQLTVALSLCDWFFNCYRILFFQQGRKQNTVPIARFWLLLGSTRQG